MTVVDAQRCGAAAILEQAGQIDALVASCLQDAVSQLQELAGDVLRRTGELEQWAGSPDAPQGVAEVVQPQLAALLRIGQFHDIFGQAAERCRTILDRRAALVGELVQALEDDRPVEPVRHASALLLQSCADEQQRHPLRMGSGAGSIELF